MDLSLYVGGGLVQIGDHVNLYTYFEWSIKGVGGLGGGSAKKFASQEGGSRKVKHGLPLFAQ